jgi:hypothetical protein
MKFNKGKEFTDGLCRLLVVLVKFHRDPVHVNGKKCHRNYSGQKQPIVIVIAEKHRHTLKYGAGFQSLRGEKNLAINEESQKQWRDQCHDHKKCYNELLGEMSHLFKREKRTSYRESGGAVQKSRPQKACAKPVKSPLESQKKRSKYQAELLCSHETQAELT